MDIISFPNNFNFDQLTLGVPNGLQGGSYFTKIYNNENKVYLQSPSCLTKQGLVKTGKKMYVDLMLTPDNQSILNWFETMVEKVQELIYEKRNVWFHNEMDLEDIESAFAAPVRTYKSGKFYLIRANINSNNFNVYDEDENPVNIEMLNDTNNKIIPLIEILGVKFTSRSFQLEISLKQIMIIQEKNMLNNCLIKRSSQLSVQSDSNTTEPKIIKETNNIKLETIEEDKETEIEEKVVEKETSNNDIVNDVQVDEDQLEEEKNMDLDREKEEQIEQDLEQEILSDIEEKENDYNLEEVSIDYNDDDQSINLKKPNEVYMEIWREARKKAKIARKTAVDAYLEAKNIKTTYMLNEIDNDSDDEFDNIIENIQLKEENQFSLA